MGTLNPLSPRCKCCWVSFLSKVTKQKGTMRAHLDRFLLFSRISLELRKLAVCFSLKYTKNEIQNLSNGQIFHNF